MAESMKQMTPEERKKAAPMSIRSEGPSFSHDQVRQMATRPHQTIMLPMIAAETRAYSNMHVAIFVMDESPGFITSDDPCVWFDPDAHLRPLMMQAPGLQWPNVEVTLPLSPTQLLMITNHCELSGWIDASPAVVQHLNRRTRSLCDEYFVVNRNVSDFGWFEEHRLLEWYGRDDRDD